MTQALSFDRRHSGGQLSLRILLICALLAPQCLLAQEQAAFDPIAATAQLDDTRSIQHVSANDRYGNRRILKR